MTYPSVQGADLHVFLIGRPPLGDLLGFIRTHAVGGQSADQGALVEEWRRANDHIRILEQDEAGSADNPPIEDLPVDFSGHTRAVAESALFRRTFQYFPAHFAMIDLDTLVVFQKHINLAIVDHVKARMGATPTPLQILQTCIPFQQEMLPTQTMQIAPNAYNFVSPSADFRFLEAVLLDPAQVGGYTFPGTPVAVIALAVGYGSNYLNVLEVENRLILNNGSHRAYALREMGVTKVPCIVQEISRRDELEIATHREVEQNADHFLTVPRPPLLRDYFDPKLRKLIPVARKAKTVKVSFGADHHDTPAA